MFKKDLKDSPITPYSDFKYWFVRNSTSSWSIIDKATNNAVGVFVESTNRILNGQTLSSLEEQDIINEFKIFQVGRPEYAVSTPLNPYNDVDTAVDWYERLIVGVAFLKSYRSNNSIDPDSVYDRIYPCLEWLRKTDFYTGPGSSIYHDSEPSGLLFHTLRVVNKVIELSAIPSFETVNLEDAVLCACVHDWCKIGLYEQYMKNVKDDVTNTWNKVPAYKRRPAPVPLSHGVASMWLASKCFRLTNDEALAIRWHMGHWYSCESDVNELQRANETVPLVHLIQFADQLAITEYSANTI